MQDIQKELFSLMKVEKKLNLSLQLYHFTKRLKKEALKKNTRTLTKRVLKKKLGIFSCMQEPDVYSYFTKTFNKLGVRYVVTGAVATIIYGVPRLTHDIDLVVELKKVDIDNIIKGFDESEFYCLPREIIGIEIGRTERGHFNIIHKTTAYKADIYLVGNDKLCMWALDN